MLGKKWFILALTAIFFDLCSYADVRLPAVISNQMVLQQNSNVTIWGWADPGEEVAVKPGWNAKCVSTKADDAGKWQQKIRTPKAGGPYTITVQANNQIVLNDILIGEVWLCSGQSNMQWSLRNSDNAQAEIANASHPQIRLFAVPMVSSADTKYDCDEKWVKCGPESAAKFSAVAYFFGKELQKELGIPIGLIGTYCGGSSAEAWVKNEVLVADKAFELILKREREYQDTFEDKLADYQTQLSDWQNKAQQAKDQNMPSPRKPLKPVRFRQNAPSGLYNGMLKPLIPYTIKGAIWYQGESNCGRAYQYRKLFPVMIENWRTDWAQGDFPFYYVQLAPYKYYNNDPNGTILSELREAQLMTLSVPNTGMAVTMDIGDTEDIHPRNKLDVGHRLALWALAKDYGRNDLVYSGPLYKLMKVEGNTIRLFFDHTAKGLIAKDGPLTNFIIAGVDRNFVKAAAVIEDNTVVVSSPAVPKPVAVRFAWTNSAIPNLFNSEDLPASSFRTDDWPGQTKGKN